MTTPHTTPGHRSVAAGFATNVVVTVNEIARRAEAMTADDGTTWTRERMLAVIRQLLDLHGKLARVRDTPAPTTTRTA